MNGKSQVKLALMMVLVAAAVFVVQAQTAAGAPAAKGGKSLWDLWVVGGPVMWPIGLCSVAGIGLSVYCGMQYRLVKMARLDIQAELFKNVQALDFQAISSLCAGAPCMLTTIMKAGLSRIGSFEKVDISAFEKAMEEASIEEITEWQKPLNHLSLTAQIAPMLGLLGTVTGMIGAFDKIGMGAMGSPEKLAGDIGEAMITTAAGLIVAIPCMFAYFVFKSHFTANVARVSRLLGDFVHHLGVAVAGGGAEAQQPAAAPSESEPAQ